MPSMIKKRCPFFALYTPDVYNNNWIPDLSFIRCILTIMYMLISSVHSNPKEIHLLDSLTLTKSFSTEFRPPTRKLTWIVIFQWTWWTWVSIERDATGKEFHKIKLNYRSLLSFREDKVNARLYVTGWRLLRSNIPLIIIKTRQLNVKDL